MAISLRRLSGFFIRSFLNRLRFIRFSPGSISFPPSSEGGRGAKHPNIHQPDPQRFSTGCAKTPLEPVRFSTSGFPGIQQRDQLDAKGAVTVRSCVTWLRENGGKMSMPVVFHKLVFVKERERFGANGGPPGVRSSTSKPKHLFGQFDQHIGCCYCSFFFVVFVVFVCVCCFIIVHSSWICFVCDFARSTMATHYEESLFGSYVLIFFLST